jgi:hypothetical protein
VFLDADDVTDLLTLQMLRALPVQVRWQPNGATPFLDDRRVAHQNVNQRLAAVVTARGPALFMDPLCDEAQGAGGVSADPS